MMYKLPQKVAPMTVHHLYGLSETGKYYTIDDYLKQQGYALAADLLVHGFKPSELEDAVNSGRIGVAHWPEREPKTGLYWLKDEKTLKELEKLMTEAVRLCYGQDERQPVGGDFASVGAEMGSQQLALVGLVYARHRGKLRELPEIDRGAGPLYIARGSFSDKMFAKLLPENSDKKQEAPK